MAANKAVFARYWTGVAATTIEKMKQDGYQITQATVSRYLKDPKVIEDIKANVPSTRTFEGIKSKEELQVFWSKVIDGSIQPKTRLIDRLKASEYLAKSYGMFIEKLDHSGVIDVAAQIVAARRRIGEGDDGES